MTSSYVIDTVSVGSVSGYECTVTPIGTTTITATWKESTVTNLDLSGYVIAPVKNEVPDVTSIDDEQYTGTISWDTSDSTFGGSTVYTATVTLTAKNGYTFDGVGNDKFTYTGETVSNSADSGEVTIVFQATADKTVTSVVIKTNPTTLDYEYGDTIDLTGLVVNATYDDNSNADITDYTVSHETFTSIGTVTVTITVDGVTTTFDVTVSKKTLTITDVNVIDRKYDGTTTVEVTGSTLEGIYDTEDVSIATTTGTSASADVGTHAVTGVNFVLSGSDKDNYTLTQPIGLEVTISKATLLASDFTVTAPSDLTYDGTEKSVTVANANIVGGGTITITYTSSSYNGTTPPTDVGIYEVLLSVTGDSNYNDISNLTDASWAFEIEKQELVIGDFTFTAQASPITYDGTEKSATVANNNIDGNITVYYTGINGINYGPSVTAPTNTGDYQVSVSVSGDTNYKDTSSLTDSSWTFEIEKAVINISDFSLIDTSDKVYTGSSIEPTVTSLVDYTVSYSNNINVTTTAKFTITGTGNYTGTIEQEFSITPKEITITGVSVVDREYDGTTKVELEGNLNGVVGSDDVSYTATGTSASEYVGTHSVTDLDFVLTGGDAKNYIITSQPTDSLTVDITKGSISDVTLSGVKSSYKETGLEIVPTVTVIDKYGNILTEGDDYTIEITNNVIVGTATIIITGTGNGNYDSEEKELTFLIVKASTNSSGSLNTTYQTTVENADNGEVDVSPANPTKDQTVTIIVTPNEGYELSTLVVVDVLGNSIEISKQDDGTYTFVQPSSKVTITTQFTEISGYVFPFTDVFESDYYYNAVKWAVQNGITYGKTTTLFKPAEINTRAETVTFLWRASGSPIVDCENPFEDVLEGTYYYNAVLWAVENGITVGTSATTFSPCDTCDRSQSVTFLYRFVGEPKVTSTNPFEDVYATDYYYNAISWAYEEGVTLGTSDSTFSPKVEISRAQMVTFLYRLAKTQ